MLQQAKSSRQNSFFLFFAIFFFCDIVYLARSLFMGATIKLKIDIFFITVKLTMSLRNIAKYFSGEKEWREKKWKKTYAKCLFWVKMAMATSIHFAEFEYTAESFQFLCRSKKKHSKKFVDLSLLSFLNCVKMLGEMFDGLNCFIDHISAQLNWGMKAIFEAFLDESVVK